MQLTRIKPHEITVGNHLPWSVYCTERALLLQKGTLISSEKQLRVLLERGRYRDLTPKEIETQAGQSSQSCNEPEPKDPFQVKDLWSTQLTQILADIVTGSAENVTQPILKLGQQIQALCGTQADSVLAALHLTKSTSYTSLHPIHTAALCELVARRTGEQPEDRLTMIAAALTMNVGMLELQEILFRQKDPLSNPQKAEIRGHCKMSVSLLTAAGVNDPIWLNAIHQHHERVDGNGYPNALTSTDICKSAKLIALADMYAALVTPRVHRKPILAQEALKAVFQKRGVTVDEELATHLIREIGVFPPGVFVKLANGDTAIVTKRAVVKKNRDSTAPTAISLISPRGGNYEVPIKRDCNEVLFKIKSMCDTQLPQSFDLSALWKA